MSHESNSAAARTGPAVECGGNEHAALHFPPAAPSGELTVMERLEAFRDLIRHGNALLGEVVTYCHEAEAAVTQFAATQQSVESLKAELIEMTAASVAATDQVRRLESDLEVERATCRTLRDEVAAARTHVGDLQRGQSGRERELERSLAESTKRHIRLQQELSDSKAATAGARLLDTRPAQLDAIEAKLRHTERELHETRQALEQERSRRDRAIALIRPKTTQEVRA